MNPQTVANKIADVRETIRLAYSESDQRGAYSAVEAIVSLLSREMLPAERESFYLACGLRG